MSLLKKLKAVKAKAIKEAKSQNWQKLAKASKMLNAYCSKFLETLKVSEHYLQSSSRMVATN